MNTSRLNRRYEQHTFSAALLKAIMPNIITAVDAAAHGPSASVSVTLVHPVKADGRNEIPFGRDTLAIPSNTVLDRGPRFGPPREGEFWGRNPL